MPTNCKLFLPVVRFSPELLPSFLFMIDFNMPVTIKETDKSNNSSKECTTKFKEAYLTHET